MSTANGNLTPEVPAAQGGIRDDGLRRRGARVYTKRPLAERFWEKVAKVNDDASCWLWTGAIQASNGYGRIATGDPQKVRVEGAHRVAYELQCGPIPNGKSILHHCDVAACVRGSHLYAGTAKNNSDDMYARGRNAPLPRLHGEDAGAAVLTESQARAILQSTETHASLANRLGVAASTIKAVRDGLSWKHIGSERAHLGKERKSFGGNRSGADHARARLTEADVLAIRQSREPSAALARRYGIDDATLAAARWGATWTHLPPSPHDRRIVEQVGERHHNARLTEAAVLAIRASDESKEVLAARYGVCPSNIIAVRARKTWRHV